MHLRRAGWVLLAVVVLAPLVAAYLQWAFAGLPAISLQPAPPAPQGFPSWLRVTHFANLLLLSLLVRSGLQVLMEHPRLYWNIHCTPGTEWLRLTPVVVPRDRVYTSKDDARYLSPWIGLPGGWHTVGMARHWHFLAALAWILCGAAYIALLFGTGQWRRLAPESWSIVPEAWKYFVHYATFHLPPEPDTFYLYNPVQKLSYAAVVFVLAPLAILTGPSMSPALTNRFHWYPKLPGNRQIGRSLHFLVLCAFLAFVALHVAMVIWTGVLRNMNHVVLGTNGTGTLGLWLALVGIAVVVAANAFAHWMAWHHPRTVQHAAKRVVTPVMDVLLNRAVPRAEFPPAMISPYFWLNGKLPTSEEWLRMAKGGWKEYRLKVFGRVERELELSLEELKALEKRTQITLHHCIQGWSGIAAWGGVPLGAVLALARPTPEARAVIFHSYGEGGEGGEYYDSLPIADARDPLTMLAYEMNYAPLGHQHGAPLRLRVENQLGFKMVKWIRAIEFVETIRTVGEGEGGYAEDNEYFGELANI